MTLSCEGATELFLPPSTPSRGPGRRSPVFYNPAMAADRDLGVAFARALLPSEGEPRRGWEMTAATGVRGLRLFHETRAFASFTFTEANPDALAVLRDNVARFVGTRAVGADARKVPAEAPFDYVDLDPYGSPVAFVPTAIAAVRAGGVVAVTATDMMVLAGAQPAACLRRYGARPVRGRLGPEGGLRILLAHLAREARKVDRSIRPLLAYARDHYVRAYVEVQDGRGDLVPVDIIDPDRWTGPSVGDRGPYGPLWLGPLHDATLVGRMEVPDRVARASEVGRFLARLKEEVTVDRPFYYEANVLAQRLHLSAPPALGTVEDGLRRLGFRVARTHARPEAFRTDAPRADVEGLFRRLARAA
ncbi:MAG TPA: hypothetical protein VEG66_08195 [Thermoplasmata archaeon]|nr:hypothetical protein [Thermoplasmata archaeon]